ncbi:MAG: sugar phosphate isomerase/epimerase [Novosphingobium sp.]
MDRLALEFISVLGMPPVEFVGVARELGVGKIGFACGQIVALPELYEPWTLRGNPGLVRDVKTALADNGVALSLGEGFLIRAGAEIADQAGDMDILAELGAPIVNVVSIEGDAARADDQFAEFARMAAQRDLAASIEYMPAMPIGTLAAARDIVVRSGQPNARVLLDAMHLYRSGGSAEDVALLDPGLVGYAQICDVPLVSAHEDYSIEARFDRRAIGDGELPLRDFVNALPAACTIGLEVPMRDKALAGIGPVERLKPAVTAARELLA